MNKTPETDKIIRNAKIADHPPTRLAATLTVKCEKLERERDEAREALGAFKHDKKHLCDSHRDMRGNCMVCSMEETK